MTQSARVLSSIGETPSAVRPRLIRLPVEEVIGVKRGGPAPWGSTLTALASRSLTSMRSVSALLPSAKIAVITEIPGAEEERKVVRKLVPFKAYSRGIVTSASTSSAERPGASVCTTIWGGENSGKMSKGERRAATTPATRSNTARLRTITRLCKEKRIVRATTLLFLRRRQAAGHFAKEFGRAGHHHVLPFLHRPGDRHQAIPPGSDGDFLFGKQGGGPAYIHHALPPAALDQRRLGNHHSLFLRPGGYRHGDGHPQLQPARRVVYGVEEVDRPLHRIDHLAGGQGAARAGLALGADAEDGSRTLPVYPGEVALKDGGFDPHGGEVGDGKEWGGRIDLLAGGNFRLDHDPGERRGQGETPRTLPARGDGGTITRLLAPGGFVTTLRLQPGRLGLLQALAGNDLCLEEVLAALVLRLGGF